MSIRQHYDVQIRDSAAAIGRDEHKAGESIHEMAQGRLKSIEAALRVYAVSAPPVRAITRKAKHDSHRS